MEARRLFLFVDWFHVQKGDLKPILDPARLSEEGSRRIEELARDFGRTFNQGEHGFRREATPYGIRIAPELAEKSHPWLSPDAARERRVHAGTVLWDEGRYRCWYHAQLRAAKTELTFSDGRAMELSGSALAYAESTDGWNWTKPGLGALGDDGSGATNFLTPYGSAGCVFRDDHGPTEERYKAFHFDELPRHEVPDGAPPRDRYGLYGLYSADGYRWTKHNEPLIRYFCDTTNIAAWDPVLQKYVGFFRHHVGGGRAISRAETEDFWDWPAPQPLLYTDPLDAPADDYYTNGYTCYPDDPSLRLLFVAVYHRNTDLVDVRMALSRDGRVFQWLSYDPVLQLGAAGEWDSGSIYAHPNLVHLPDGCLALPYGGRDTTHNEAWFQSFYSDFDSSIGGAWALWKDGRLAGIEAGDIGAFTTHAALFEGEQIEINARTTRSGTILLELQEGGKPIEGFSFGDSVPFSGDEVWTKCRWNGKKDLAGLCGKKLVMAFQLQSAKVFALRFV